jgi:hypothetical protein
MSSRRPNAFFAVSSLRDSERKYHLMPSCGGLDRSSSNVRSTDSVYRRIASLIGATPNRSDLIAIVAQLGWVSLGRNEKRIKQLLIQKLESKKDQIIPLLESPQGVRALENAYAAVLNRKRAQTETGSRVLSGERHFSLPPEATVEFYLNEH